MRIGVVAVAAALAAGCGGAKADEGTIRLAQQAYERAKAAGEAQLRSDVTPH